MALQLTRPVLRSQPRLLAAAQFLPTLMFATVAAALVELTLLRLLSRVAIHIPDVPALRGVYSAAVQAGTVTFPVAALLAAALVTVAAMAMLPRAPILAIPALALLGAQAALLVAGESALGTAAHQWLLAVALLAVLFYSTSRRMALFVAGVGVAQAAGLAQAASANLAAEGGWALPLSVAGAGESLLLVTLLAAPVLVGPRRWSRRDVIAGGVVALIGAGMLFGNASTARTLALWTFGLGMPLPALLYAITAGAMAATLIALLRTGAIERAGALTLIVLGGFVPPNSYQAGLLLAGVMLLVLEQPRGPATTD